METVKVAEKKLKSLAKEAVSRMKHGFWEDMLQAKARGEITQQKTATEVFEKTQLQTAVLECVSKSRGMDDFEKRAISLLEDGEISPIGKLIDKKKYETLSFEERGRYVLQISSEFLKIKEKHEREKQLKQKYSNIIESLNI